VTAPADSRSITPLDGPLDVTVGVPGSKSIANRALICAALATGTSTLHGLPSGDDTSAMLDGLAVLGLTVERGAHGAVYLTGGVERMRRGPLTIDARLAGTTSRFLTAMAALGPGPYTIDGAAPLRARPMGPLHQALADLGVSLRGARPGFLPVDVQRPIEWSAADGATTPTVHIAGDISSQYISALMMIAPLLPGGLTLQLTTALISRPYVGITVAVMEQFGIGAITIDEQRIVVPPQPYRAVEMTIEPDASSASYPLAAAAICGGRVTVAGLTDRSVQGDAAFADLLGAMGCTVDRGAATTTVTAGPTLRGIDVDMADVSDLVPTLAVVALFASTPTTIRGVGFIRAKESDRLGDLARELNKLGAMVSETSDGLQIQPVALHGGRIGTHHDHRLAMAGSLIGLRVPGVTIEDPNVVTKSWPEYWAMLDGLG